MEIPIILFRETGHKNYAKEAALLLINFQWTSSERIAAQIMTGLFM